MRQRISEEPLLEGVAATSYTPGQVVIFNGDTIAIVPDSVAVGAEFQAHVRGVFELAKATGVNLSIGEDVFWDATASKLTTVLTGNTRIGVVARSATTTAAKGRILLNHPNVTLAPNT